MVESIAFAPYRGTADLHRMLALSSRCWCTEGPDAQVHPGNLCWRLAALDHGERQSRVGLWSWRGELLGFAINHPQSPADLQVDPEWLDSDGLYATMACWAGGNLTLLAGGRRDGTTPGLACLLNRGGRAGILTGLGFSPGTRCYQRLSADPREATPPSGHSRQWSLRKADGTAGIDVWLGLYRRVFDHTRLTAAGLRRVMNSPGYRPRLSRVAVDRNGRPVAFVQAWLDPASRSVEFEPVGCDPRWRRRGLVRALMLDTLSRAAVLGATRASVTTRGDDPGVIRFYQRCGFRRHVLEREFMAPGHALGAGGTGSGRPHHAD